MYTTVPVSFYTLDELKTKIESLAYDSVQFMFFECNCEKRTAVFLCSSEPEPPPPPPD